MSNAKAGKTDANALFALVSIPVAIVVATLIYMFVLGNEANFEDGDVTGGHPLNLMGTIHKGGFIVPILISVNLIILIFSIERFITIAKAKGKGSVEAFIARVREMIGRQQLDAAISECDKQKGSLANVLRSGLEKYKEVEHDSNIGKDEKIAAIQKELEEATTLELPMLSKNLVILSTCASISTLIGLIGTVFGMIRAFAALAQAGAPDAVALSTGISEALINTALGIIGSTIAIIMYNYFSNRIDTLTYGIDEAGFSLVQSFNATHKK
ncbi:MAG TPA: MotA/TolQ/ExbB proton channel family protein [Luteibaculaceae bacterium]|jgi:biopolymer transport protein ExbB|nr:MotA/TolQ/ExbB proton channel family protein [Luteibaculaceae bacterium]